MGGSAPLQGEPKGCCPPPFTNKDRTLFPTARALSFASPTHTLARRSNRQIARKTTAPIPDHFDVYFAPQPHIAQQHERESTVHNGGPELRLWLRVPRLRSWFGEGATNNPLYRLRLQE